MTSTEHEEQTDQSYTDFGTVLLQHNKGATHAEVSRALAEVVGAALDTGKKGYVTVKAEVEPLQSGTVRLRLTTAKKVPEDPAASIWFADGEGTLSRDNAGMFYAGH